MRLIKLLLPIIIIAALAACGDPDVDLTGVQYEPKIAVEAYLFCGESVKDIRLTRNFPIGTSIDSKNLFLTPQNNKVNVTLNGTLLNFDPVKKTYYNNQLKIDYNTTYRIEINAEINGKQLTASSTTLTPQKGFSVFQHDFGTVKYKHSKLNIDFKTSPGTDLYIFSFIADSATMNNFIYDNPYFPNMDTSLVRDNFNGYRYQLDELSDINSFSNDTYSFELKDYDTWFYSPYTVTIYAGDKNLRYYLSSATNVKEFDGNFHEPIQIFEGDGIGVFASAIKEVVKFRIIK